MRLLSALFLFLCTACYFGEEEIGISIKSFFDSPFPGRPKNLQLILGNEFRLKSGLDTIYYSVSFDHKSRMNYILDTYSLDTIFSGTVCKDRGLFYFNERLNDSVYHIYAVRIDQHTITGIGSSFEQMLAWDLKFDNLFENPEEIVHNRSTILKYVDTLNQTIRLSPVYKKAMKDFYSLQLDNMTPDTIIRINNSVIPDSISITSAYPREKLPSPEPFEIIDYVGPNPAKDHVKVVLKSGFPCKYAIYNLNGQQMSFGEFYYADNHLDITGYASGMYILQIFTSDNKEETIGMVVE